MSDTLVLYFNDEATAAHRFAAAAGFECAAVDRHRFPDGELKLRLPATLPAKVIVYRSLVHPNEKLIELLFVAQTARQLGAADVMLIAPYLAYMRQDIAFHEGEVVSQKIIGRFLAQVFDDLATIDPHLHRVSTLEEASPVKRAITLSGAPYSATTSHSTSRMRFYSARIVNQRSGLPAPQKSMALIMRPAKKFDAAIKMYKYSCRRWI